MAPRAGTVSLRELIDPFERQSEFFAATDRYRYVLYGGARGGGKSYILRWALVRFLLRLTARGFRNVRVGLFCITYNELWLRQISKVLIEFPAWLGRYDSTHHEFRFAESLGGHIIQFCNMQKLQMYQGGEFAAIAVDELTLSPDREVFHLLRSCLRWTDKKTKRAIERCPFWAATNPTGGGHTWVKQLWITKDFSDPSFKKLPKDEFCFVRSLPSDNPRLSEEYQEELDSLPEYLREPWLKGSWDILAGQRFSSFRVHVHVSEPFDVRALGPTQFYRSIDYGTYDPYACGLYAAVNVGRKLPDIYKIAEDVYSGIPAKVQAQRVLDLTRDFRFAREQDSPPIGRVAQTWLDTQCWAEEDMGLSIAQLYQQQGVPVTQALKDREAGWEMMDDALWWEHAEGDPFTVVKAPRLHVFSTCPVTIQQIQDAMWDPKKGKDILHPPEFRDDALDETRYMLLSHARGGRKGEPQGWQEHHKRVARAMARHQ